MNISKQQLIAIVVAIFVIVGGVFAYMTWVDSGEDTAQQDSVSEGANTSNQENGDPSFEPLSIDSESFIATVRGQGDDGPIDGSIESDGEGNFRLNFIVEGESSSLIITTDATYSCTAGECFEFPRAEDGDATSFGAAIDPEQFTFNEDDYAEFRTTAVYRGTEDCSAGTCDVWFFTDEGVDSQAYIDSDSNRIVRVESSQENNQYIVEYDYQTEVTITPPENAQQLPSQF